MSQSDVRSILNLPSSSQSSHIRPPTGAGLPLQRQRPEGVSREVYNLIGDNVPSLQAAVFDAAPALKFKERPKSIVKRPKAEKWYVYPLKGLADGWSVRGGGGAEQRCLDFSAGSF